MLNFRLDVLNGKDQIEISKKQLRTAQIRLLLFLRLPEDYTIIPILNDSVILQDVDLKKTVTLARQNSSSILDFQKRKLEAAMNIQQAKAKSRFDAKIDLSYGLNQRHEELNMAYQDLLDQQMVNITLNIPLLDWGQRKGKYKLAQKQYQAKIISLQQAEAEFNQSIITIAEDFNLQYNKLTTTQEADKISDEAYSIVKQRFMIGKADMNTLNMFQTKQIQAKKNYIAVLEAYWKYYYNIRKITLFNFENNTPLTVDFDKLILD